MRKIKVTNSNQSPQTDSKDKPPQPKSGTNKPTVVLVDDDDTILRSLKVALSSKYAVTCFNDPVRAVEALENMTPHVVVLDVVMPEHDGFWVYRAIRKFNTQVPIIFNSAYQSTLEVHDVMALLKPFGYLPKNGKLGDMLALLAQAVQSHTPTPR